MSILRNLLGAFMPHFESRRATAALSTLNGELVLDVNGDESLTVRLDAATAFTGTYTVEGSVNGFDYDPLLCFLVAGLNGTLPLPGQPLLSEVSTTAIKRTICAAVGGLQKVRVRLSAYTSGSIVVVMNSDACPSISPYVRNMRAATLHVTATGAANAAVTATLPAVVGLRHYLDRISVVRSATVALTATATPVLVTMTNTPGSPVLTFGSDVAGIGLDKELVHEFGGAGISTLLVNTATTIVCPVYTGVIWRVNASYRLGL